MKLPTLQIIVEQLALLFASLIWTVVILSMVVMLWAYQDLQQWRDLMRLAPPSALAQAGINTPTITPLPTDTPWAPPPTYTPAPTEPPTPTATWVIPPPGLLPETLNADDPTPMVVEQAEGQVSLEFSQPTPTAQAVAVVKIESTATPQPTDTPVLLPTDTPIAAVSVAQVLPTPTPPAQVDAASAAMPTHLQIPSVGIDAPIVSVGWDIVVQNGQEYSLWQVADNAVGWHQTSAPLGSIGNTVMAGHHNVNGEVFRDLVNVEVGDTIIAYAGGVPHQYEVTYKTIVKEKGEPIEARRKNAEWIVPTDDERITLITCWPYTNNTHRVIVVAKPM